MIYHSILGPTSCMSPTVSPTVESTGGNSLFIVFRIIAAFNIE